VNLAIDKAVEIVLERFSCIAQFQQNAFDHAGFIAGVRCLKPICKIKPVVLHHPVHLDWEFEHHFVERFRCFAVRGPRRQHCLLPGIGGTRRRQVRGGHRGKEECHQT
jgi:hypothetical protein